MSNLIGIPEAALLFGVNRATVWEWVKAGKLEAAAYVGKQALFERSYIEREAQKRREQQQTETEAVA
jgi:excisionase family DNA binding protein